MTEQRSHTDRQLRDIERRIAPSVRRNAMAAARQILWRLSCRSGRFGKRILDVVVAVIVLFLAAPAMALAALLIKMTDGGPALFWQVRIGKWGRPFQFPKFRSMVVNAEALQPALMGDNQHRAGVTFKIKRDPRITWIGRILRKTSMDELPQLWCVLKGEMSLVGPRPALVHEVALYSIEDRRRLSVTPGLTCTWQVSGRSEIAFPEQVELDVGYIEQQSLKHDLALLFKTIPAVISGRGAY